MANSSQLEPTPYSLMSLPLIDKGPSSSANYAQLSTEQEVEGTWMANLHITGLVISASRVCGEANYVKHGDCTVCGKSFAMIQEESTLGYMEKTHEPDEKKARGSDEETPFNVV